MRVLAQSSQYKMEYESSLKEMYDTHQFDNRLRRISSEIDNSQRKAKVLEEELEKINNSWV